MAHWTLVNLLMTLKIDQKLNNAIDFGLMRYRVKRFNELCVCEKTLLPKVKPVSVGTTVRFCIEDNDR